MKKASAVAAMCLLAACAEAPKPAPKPKEPPQPITGLSAIFRMYQMARTWAPDAMPLRAQSVNLQSVASDGGKAGAWIGTFVSESRKKSRSYTYSAIEGEGFHEGVFARLEEDWAGPTRQSQPFRIEALKKDSEAAWTVAAEKSQAFIKKNPDVPVFFLVEYSDRFPNPAWRVIWGESVSKSGYSIFVDTVDGIFLMTGR
jgi:hypothetical protein